MKFGYTHLDENQFTATLTDIGVIRLDDKIGKMVESIYFVLGKQKTKPINIAVSTYGETVRLIVSYDTDCSDFVEAANKIISIYIITSDRDE